MKEKLKRAFSLDHDTTSYDEIRERIIDGGRVTGTNLCILMLAILIASIGLNMNSTAVIIGAMLISPIMGSIQAIGYGAAVGDSAQIKKSGVGFLFQIVICLSTSTLYFLLSPISTQTSELLARTQPNIWDVLIAIAGGIAGMIGMTRKEKSNVIPGVAIATALMPPLCTCGYGIAHAKLNITLGAGLLFLVNAYFIFISSVLVLLALKMPQKEEYTPRQLKWMKRRAIITTIIILIPCIAVAGYMAKNANEDSSSVTGFETVVPIGKVSSEIKILFPEVEEVKIGSMESLGEDGSINNETSVFVYLNKEMDAEDSERMEQWLIELYNGSCNVIISQKQ